MKLEPYEDVVEKVTMTLLSLDTEAQRQSAAIEAVDMAARASRGWWELAGSPHFTKRMSRIKRALGK